MLRGEGDIDPQVVVELYSSEIDQVLARWNSSRSRERPDGDRALWDRYEQLRAERSEVDDISHEVHEKWFKQMDRIIQRVNSTLHAVQKYEKQMAEGKDVKTQLQQAYRDAIGALEDQIILFRNAPIARNWEKEVQELKARLQKLER